MKKICILLIFTVLLCSLSGCGNPEAQQLIMISVIGNSDEFYPCYEDRIKKPKAT